MKEQPKKNKIYDIYVDMTRFVYIDYFWEHKLFY
jgi:hypothetical protein